METEFCVERLSKERESFLLAEIGFSLPEGYMVGVAGRNGSGKSTLLSLLAGGNLGEYGAVTIGSHRWDDCGVRENVTGYRRQFSFVLEEYPFPDYLSATDVARQFGGWYEGFEGARFEELLSRLSVPPKRPAARLSQGMRVKLQMAFAFSYSSRVLLLDEPSAHLDTFARKELYDLLYDYMEPGGRTVLWASHLTDELDRMADYLLVLEKGEQKLFGEKEALLSDYRIVKGSKKQLDCMKKFLIGRIDRDTYSEGMARAEDGPFPLADTEEIPNVEQLLCYLFGTEGKRERK